MANKLEILQSAVSSLKKSPIFNFSLSSKELFHSNFLYWLCNNHREDVIRIFTRRMLIPPDLSKKWCVYREKEHHDLTFEFEDGKVLIVENKVKSIPTEMQLRNYSKPYQNKPEYSFLLLSLVKPTFTTITDGKMQINGAIWAVMDYEELAKELRSLVSTIEKRNLYHSNLVSDYAEFIGHVSDIARLSTIEPESSENFFEYDRIMPILKELRIHDLAYKRIFSDMAQFMVASLRHSGYKVQNDGLPENGKKGQIFVDSYFTNGTGMFTVYYVVLSSEEFGGPCFVEIQLQDNLYRLFFRVKGNKRAKKISEILADEKLWFNFDKLPKSSIIDRKRKEKLFYNYYGSHLYRYKKIHNIPPKELVEITIEYINQAKRNTGRIRKIVKQYTK